MLNLLSFSTKSLDDVLIFAVIIEGFALLITSFITGSNQVFSKKTKLNFILSFAAIWICSFIEWICISINIEGRSDLVWLNYTINLMGFLIAPLITIFIANAINEPSNKKYEMIPYAIYGAYVITAIILTAFKLTFRISEDNVYHRGPAFIFLMIMNVLSELYLLYVSIRVARRYLSKYPINVFLFFFGFLTAIFVQFFASDMYLTWIIVTVISIIYAYYYSELIHQLDGLTGLFSQFSFIKAVEKIEVGQKLIVLDIDDFKSINDKYGHPEGDKYLVAIAKIMQQVFGKYGSCFRTGGDEFSIIVDKQHDVDLLIDTFENRIDKEIESNPIFPKVSAGYKTYKTKTYIKDFKKDADKAMYDIKMKRKAKD